MRLLTRTRAALLAGVLLIGAACSDDDDADADDFVGSMSGHFSFSGRVDEGSAIPIILERLASFGIEPVGVRTSSHDTGGTFEVSFDPVSEDGELEVTALESLRWQGVLRLRPVVSTVDGPGVTTPPEADEPGVEVHLPELDGEAVARTFHLGTTAVAGDLVHSAKARQSPGGQWEVQVTVTETGITRLNNLAEECFIRSARCPTGQIAVVVDSEVLSAPAITQPAYQRDEIVISRDFTEREAQALAAALQSGPLPISLTPGSEPAGDEGPTDY